MRSVPALTASSNTRRDPSTFSSRVRSLASRIANARCTTTWASFTRPRTLAASVTSPWRYSVLRQPRSAGSKGLRAMPRIRLTARDRSSASTMPRPRSPVGPVTATVRPVLAIGAVLSDSGAARVDVLAAAQQIDRIGDDAVLARAALNSVAPVVAHADRVVAGAAVDRVGTPAAGHLVVERSRADAVVPAASVDHRRADGAHDVVAGTGVDGDIALVRVDPVLAGARVDEVRAAAGVDRVVAGAAEQPVAVGLTEERVGSRAAQHQVGAGARVDDVVARPGVHAVVAGPGDDEVDPVAAVDAVGAGAGLEVVVRAESEQLVVAGLPVELVGHGRARQSVRAVGADPSRGDRDRAGYAEERERRDECGCAALHRLLEQRGAAEVALMPARSRARPGGGPRRRRCVRRLSAGPARPRGCGPCRVPPPPTPYRLAPPDA